MSFLRIHYVKKNKESPFIFQKYNQHKLTISMLRNSKKFRYLLSQALWLRHNEEVIFRDVTLVVLDHCHDVTNGSCSALISQI